MAIRRREWLVLGLALAAVLLFGANFRVVRVSGMSMAPTFRDGDTLLMWRTARFLSPYKAGDVVILKADDGDELIKRIAFIQNPNGTARMPESLWTPNGPMRVPLICLAENRTEFPEYQADIQAARRGIAVSRTVYVLGDNTWNSDDSRDFGPVAPRQILGRVIARFSQPSAADLVTARGRRLGRR